LKLNADSLARHLEQQLLPTYLISGDEPLIAGEAADAIRGRARVLGFTEREVLFLDRGADCEAVWRATHTLSLFAARRIIEVRLPSGKPGTAGARALTSIIESLGPDTLLLILTGRLEREAQHAEWVRAVDTRGAWIAVWPVATERLVPWLAARCRQLGLSADAGALELLAERTQGNLLAARQELEKLVLLLDDRRISVDAVMTSSADSARFDVGELTEALLAGECARALRVLSGLRAEHTELPLVLWAVVRALQGLWVAASGSQDGRFFGGPRQAAALAQARRRAPRLPFTQLIERAARADAMAKGRLHGDAWDELALLAADLCGQPALPWVASRAAGGVS
jgi:DNA polymerase-3 subunit delta